MKNILTLITFLASVNLAIAQECDLPPAVPPTNTGSNMTLFLTEGFITALDIQNEPAYIIVFDGDLIVGYKDLFGVPQTSLSIWGDDSLTPELDGAEENGEPLSFQLVDGSSLYDIEMPTPVTYTTGGLVPLMGFLALTDACTFEAEVLGCMDETAFNYSADANTDDGSCEAIVLGCIDETAFNYNADVNTDDGSCVADVEGCMDSDANNYNADANTDDGSCEFTSSSGVPIEYQLSSGWNMVGYTGTADNNGIVAQMDAALGNGAGTANTFQVIKNVSGAFWSAAFAQITQFTQGEGYMMYVIGDATTVNFQQSSGYNSGITYQLSTGWNMAAFTGDVNADNNIVSSMDNALGNGAGTANTFQVIKNVSGAFWSAAFAQITEFTPGEAYMMYVIGDATTVNFQQ
jgi:hypothetical protein